MADATHVEFLSTEARLGLYRRLQLSEREAQVVGLILRDESEAGIASHLGISSHTVHTHLERLYRKLNVTSRCQVVIRLFRDYVERAHPNDPAASATVRRRSKS